MAEVQKALRFFDCVSLCTISKLGLSSLLKYWVLILNWVVCLHCASCTAWLCAMRTTVVFLKPHISHAQIGYVIQGGGAAPAAAGAGGGFGGSPPGGPVRTGGRGGYSGLGRAGPARGRGGPRGGGGGRRYQPY